MKTKLPFYAVATMLLIAGCNPPVQQSPSADFIISSTGSGENSIATMPPVNNSNHGGTIAFNRGVGWHITSGFAIFKNIYANGAIDNTNATEAGFTANSTPGEINEAKDSLSSSTDNQMVRMDDGSLLIEKNCFFWRKNPKITWMKDSIDYHHAGDRSAACFWRSTDSGKSWSLYSWIDPVNYNGDTFALPQNPLTNGYYHHAGIDRPELYFCPFTHRVYLTCNMKYGNPKDPAHNIANTFLFYSDDHAKTWKEIGWLDDGSPDMMTSTGDGKLFLISYGAVAISMHYTKEVNGKPTLMRPFQVGYVVNGKTIPKLTSSNPFNISWNATSQTISRVTVDPTQVYDVVRVAYQIANGSLNQEYAVLDVFYNKETDTVFTVPLTIIKAADTAHYHVTFGTFIDPDFMEIPASSGENTSVFYWIEQSIPGTPVHVMAKYCVFTNGLDYTSPQYLSLDASNQPRNWTSANGEGDYLKGGFFWYNNTMNYLCDWNEENGIHGNLITIQPTNASAGLKYNKASVNPDINRAVNWNSLQPKGGK